MNHVRLSRRKKKQLRPQYSLKNVSPQVWRLRWRGIHCADHLRADEPGWPSFRTLPVRAPKCPRPTKHQRRACPRREFAPHQGCAWCDMMWRYCSLEGNPTRYDSEDAEMRRIGEALWLGRGHPGMEPVAREPEFIASAPQPAHSPVPEHSD